MDATKELYSRAQNTPLMCCLISIIGRPVVPYDLRLALNSQRLNYRRPQLTLLVGHTRP